MLRKLGAACLTIYMKPPLIVMVEDYMPSKFQLFLEIVASLRGPLTKDGHIYRQP